ncbi:PH domain-containing protein [Virgibacillus sp. W0430]|uniref:PH domain-containing protein n=1 Tax=Virgibacillus sp. W0430 TaxID=3391580 RepID=UPI003F45E321
MRLPPKNNIAIDAIKVWKITALIYIVFYWLLTIAGVVFSYKFNIPLWYSYIAAALGIIVTYVFIFLIPKLRYRRWKYEIFEQEIYIQHGILIVTRTLVPMLRVQHVDTKQGPILKRFKLATVTISTAATTHEIPALLEEDASDLRDRISTLAKVDEDDV